MKKQMEPVIKKSDHTDFVEKDTSVKPVESDELTPTEKFLTSYSIDSEIIDAFLYQERKHLSRLAGEMTELKELVVKKRATIQQEMLDLMLTEQQLEAKHRDYEFSVAKSERRLAYLEKQRPTLSPVETPPTLHDIASASDSQHCSETLVPPPPPSQPPPPQSMVSSVSFDSLEKKIVPSSPEQQTKQDDDDCILKEKTLIAMEEDVVAMSPVVQLSTVDKTEKKVDKHECSIQVTEELSFHVQQPKSTTLEKSVVTPTLDGKKQELFKEIKILDLGKIDDEPKFSQQKKKTQVCEHFLQG